ncbi:phenylalanine--tRNA ligase subunit beta [Desulfonatronovibrio hydrogenovorans]|uniref:phenylalanine--tRNA ligase subunit beta n=1 Tax=Desulfonatronovibrio hydrogenovorans TaxID=53245 RepID=UPI00048DCA01|nr:phenylalanine--tRNA ligase subunit beta [Desulfonatronovibrio hydrogenovorans]
MLLSLSWLKEFTPYDGSVDELAHRLTMVGLEVEEVKRPFAHLSGLVVGHVLERSSHPDADKLSLCKVDIGTGEPLSIVCGAPNVASGQKVAVAPVGTELPGGLVIKKARIRGQLSQGMICSETELELGSDSSGIMVLKSDLAPGSGLIEALNLEECVLDIGVTPNRPDCLSVLGLARETAAVFDLPLGLPCFDLQEDESVDCPSQLEVIIDDPSACPLYQARLISDCRVGPSPDWIRYRLMAVGIRPINNIVDVTNYVLMELGQPLHSFDRDLLSGSRIRVARARQGMKFKTLDDQSRELVSTDLLILDEQNPVALAGVMGGADSEIHSASQNVLLECAVFDPLTIRKTARRLGLSSESSFRFERGVDQVGSRFALDRAAALMQELSGGRVANKVSLAQPRPYKPRSISFRPARANSLLALDLDQEYCQKNLELLGCRVSPDQTVFQVEPPSFRPDLEREVDLIEEVGRLYGLDRIAEHLPRIKKSLDQEPLGQSFDFISAIKSWGKGLGLNEAVNYSFVGNSDLDLLGIDQESRVKVFNPLSEDQDVLRTDLLPGLLQTLKHNLGHGNNRVRVFEVARSFLPDPDSETGVSETNRLAILLYGPRHQGHWPYPDEESDYSDIKGYVENLVRVFIGTKADFRPDPDHSYLLPGVECLAGDAVLGGLGRVNPDLARSYKARKEVWFADIDLDQLRIIHGSRQISFQTLPRFPVVKRDMTVVAPLDLKYQQVVNLVMDAGQKILEDLTLMDVYLPKGTGEKNMSFRFTYRHPEKTLKDKEVDKVHQRLADLILKKLPVRFS